MRSIKRFLWQPMFLGGVFLFLTAEGGLRQDELECEEAVKHLADCCPNLDAKQFTCTYSEGCSSSTYPDLSIDDSRCIESASCSALRTQGTCEKARTITPNPTTTAEVDDGSLSHATPIVRICQ